EVIHGAAQTVPTEQMIMRIISSILDKRKIYKEKWPSKAWFDDKKPFVVAVNSGIFPHPQNLADIPLILKALFGVNHLALTIPLNGGKPKTHWTFRKEIMKDDSPVPVNIFLNPEFADISAVIFSDTAVLNHPKKLGKDCIVVHNPHATNPLDKKIFKFLEQWEAD